MEEVIKSYKGFEKDMTCRDFQYEEGKEYEEDKAEACKTGFHACEYPLDCFGHYAPSTSVYHEVEQSGKLSKSSDDSKVAATKIKIGARIGIPGLVQAAIEYTTERTKQTEDAHNIGNCGASSYTGNYGASSNTVDYGASSNTGYCGASSNTGYYGASSNTGNCGASSNTGNRGASSNTGNGGASSNTGYYGASSNTGYCGASSNTGNCGASSNTGYYGASSNTGDYGASSNTGYRGASSNTGDYGASSNTGNCGASSNTGYRGTCEANHPNSVAAAWGPESKAKGVIGATLVFAEWYRLSDKYWKEDAWEFRGSMMVRVDGKNIKEDTWYWMKGGKIVEAKDE